MKSSLSVLYINGGYLNNNEKQPEYFEDLNLEIVIKSIVRLRKGYDIDLYLNNPLHDVKTIIYRQEIMRDIDGLGLLGPINKFSERIRVVNRFLKIMGNVDYSLFKLGWFLEAVLMYVEAVENIAREFEKVSLKSRGLVALDRYIEDYIHSKSFINLSHDARKIKSELKEIKYCIVVQDGKLVVKKHEKEEEYSSVVERTFNKFKQGDVDNYLVKVSEGIGMGHVEAKILEFVANLYPIPFRHLKEFFEENKDFLDSTILDFEKDIQYYIAYLEFIEAFRRRGLPFCYPKINTMTKDEYVRNGFDVSLAYLMSNRDASIVLNDYYLNESERIIVVTGPNQGGKTTFARMFGQLHYFASLGFPIPGSQAQLCLYDEIFTHFDKQENVQNLHGKLEDSLFRIRNILEKLTSRSILIVNEIFSSTTLQDAVFLSKKILQKVSDKDALCVWVTFIDELSNLNTKTVSMVATVDPNDPTKRTFRIERMPADGLAYAQSLVEKYKLTEKDILARVNTRVNK